MLVYSSVPVLAGMLDSLFSFGKVIVCGAVQPNNKLNSSFHLQFKSVNSYIVCADILSAVHQLSILQACNGNGAKAVFCDVISTQQHAW